MKLFGGPHNEFMPRNFCCVGPEGAPATGGGGSTTGSTSSAAGSGVADASPSASGAPPSSSASGSPSAPPNATPNTPDSGEAEASVNFDDLFGGTSPDAGAEPSPPAGAQPKTPDAAQPPAAGAEPAAPVEAQRPASAEPAPPSPQATSPSLSPADPQALAHALIQHEAQAIEHLAASQFQLTQAEVEALENDVVGTLPKIMAKVAVKVQQMTFANFARIVPAMLSQHTATTARSKENEDAFFSAWPTLNKASHGSEITRIAKAYRAAHPQASREQMFQDVGMMVSMAMKVPLPQPGAQPARAASPPNGHALPGTRTQPSPWQPAGATAAMGASPSDGNPFDFLGQHQDE